MMSCEVVAAIIGGLIVVVGTLSITIGTRLIEKRKEQKRTAIELYAYLVTEVLRDLNNSYLKGDELRNASIHIEVIVTSIDDFPEKVVAMNLANILSSMVAIDGEEKQVEQSIRDVLSALEPVVGKEVVHIYNERQKSDGTSS